MQRALYSSFVLVVLFFPILSYAMATAVNRRADGVIMNYDPFHPDMMEKYGAPGETDNEGFNPYTVINIIIGFTFIVPTLVHAFPVIIDDRDNAYFTY